VFLRQRQQHIRPISRTGRAPSTDLAERFAVSEVNESGRYPGPRDEKRWFRARWCACAQKRRSVRSTSANVQRRRRKRIGATRALVIDRRSTPWTPDDGAGNGPALEARGGWRSPSSQRLRIASELAGHPGITVDMPGGFVRWRPLSLVGRGCRQARESEHSESVHGCSGITLENGSERRDEEEAQIKV